MDNDSRKETSVSISVIQFVKDAIEGERRLGTAENEKLRNEIAHLKELFGVELKAVRDVIVKDLTETQRRLSDLNHAHEQKVADMTHYVAQDMYDDKMKGMDSWRETVNTALGTAAGRQAAWAAAVLIAISLLGLALHFWK
jgi:hypothetical protein